MWIYPVFPNPTLLFKVTIVIRGIPITVGVIGIPQNLYEIELPCRASLCFDLGTSNAAGSFFGVSFFLSAARIAPICGITHFLALS